MKCYVEPAAKQAAAKADPLSTRQLDALVAWAEDAENVGLFPSLTQAIPSLVTEVQWFRTKAVERARTAAKKKGAS